MTTTFKALLRPSTVADHPGSIVYRLTHHRISRLITTDYKVFPSEWNESRCTVATADPSRTTIINTISQRLRWDAERLSQIVKDLDSQGREYTTDDVVAEFQRIVQKNSLFNFMEAYILRLQQLNHAGTAHNYRATLNSFKRFRNGEDILIESIDHLLIEDYQAWLKASGLVPNSIAFYMRILRAMYNRAINQGLTQDRRPFRTVSTGMERTRKRAISIGDVKRIQDLDLTLHPSLAFARDIFMFQFLCRGMSFIDAVFLKKTDIVGGTITYRRRKTNQPLHIKVVSQIQSIIDRHSVSDSPYLLPIIAHPNDNGCQQPTADSGKQNVSDERKSPVSDERKQYAAALRRVNNALKHIGKLLNINVPLTTYVSRHSWASIAKSKNISVNVISDALGHDSIATTQTYLATIDTSAIDRANALVIKDL